MSKFFLSFLYLYYLYLYNIIMYAYIIILMENIRVGSFASQSLCIDIQVLLASSATNCELVAVAYNNNLVLLHNLDVIK